MVRTSREREWAGAFNARDLGGIPLAEGRVSGGVLFRSGQPEAWRPEGFVAAAEDGVRRILDLRDPTEPGGVPEAAATAGISYGFSPVEDPRDPEFRARFDPYLNHPSGYADFAAMFPDRVAAALGRVLDEGPGTVVCCSAGRDRTGLVTSVLLLALGADPDALLAEDECASRAVNERHRTRATPHPYERWVPESELRVAVASRRDALAEFIREFDAREFLAEYGIDSAAFDTARSWLVA